jgi:acetyltransferase-like isoleucine patch superfamily enzyme
MKQALKALANGLFLVVMFPGALLSGFGRCRGMFEFFSRLFSFAPGLIGDYARRAYYRMTLRRCSPHCRISFGSFFAHPEATVEDGVYIGSYCIIGRAHLGARSQIASNVHILSGAHQHARGPGGQLGGADEGTFREIRVGSDCWIGTSAILMADVGDGSTVGAGSVVTRPVPPGVVAVGNPARVIKDAVDTPAVGA